MTIDLSKLNPTGRFSNRVDNYVKYRPSYPSAIIPFFKEQFRLTQKAVVADIGSGTGIFAALLLLHGFHVWCVEPNDAMRAAAENDLSGYKGFKSYNGRGEATSLADHSVDLITVAQAFHWMEPVATKQEFTRILKPGGKIALIWNIRLHDTPFLAAYEQLKNTYGTDYTTSGRDIQPVLAAFFAPSSLQLTVFPYEQLLDFEAMKGQLLSASYIPLPGQPRYEEMMDMLISLFEKHQENGLVSIRYETKVYWGGPL